MRSRDVRTASWRLRVTRVLLLAVFTVLAARAAHLSVVDHRGAQRGMQQTRRVLTLPPERGTIVDRDGNELALSVYSPSVYALPSALENREAAAAKIAQALDTDAKNIRARLRDRQSFVFLARWVTAERAERVRALALPGVGILSEPRRIYPHKELTAQVVGFANIDGVGVRGVEQQEDEWLRGTTGRLQMERDARGNLLVADGGKGWSTAGGDIALTIDAALQADAAAALREAVAATGARGGIVISMDPHSGDILALAEAPSFDPNRFREVDYAQTRSRAFLDALEPGSTLKAFLVAAALERGAIGVDQSIDCENGSFRVPGKTIHDSRPHGQLTPADILRVSSNIGAVKIAYRLGPAAHFEMLQRFGFGTGSGSGFPDESAGLLRGRRSWRPVDHATIAFGQGVSVTPIQLAAATATLANGGLRVQPRLVAARRAPGGAWQWTRSRRPGRTIRTETAAAVLEMLDGVVAADGTGRRAGLRGVRVAGKTGTAQKFDASRGTYAADRFVAWFIGIAPADDPRLVMVVALDEPKRPNHTGGAAAAPLFARAAAAQLTRLGVFTAPQVETAAPEPPAALAVAQAPKPAVPPVSAGVPKPAGASVAARAPATQRGARRETGGARVARAGQVSELARMEDRVLLPDFRGFTVAEVKRITAREGFEVQISGRGRAVAQEPPPGTVVAIHGAPVRVTFADGGNDG